jgi:hypothetical protein
VTSESDSGTEELKREEQQARERLSEAQADATDTLEEAEQLEEQDPEQERTEES